MPLSLTNLHCVPTGLHSDFDAITSLELDSTPLGGGNFGTNYVCTSLNGSTPALPLVVKILQDDGKGSAQHGSDTIQKLQERLRDLNARRVLRGEPTLAATTALWGVPQFYFEGNMNGKAVCGYGALRLDTQGFTLFDTFTDSSDSTVRQRFLSVPLAQRIQMAHDLAEGFRLLEEIGFVHADLNPQNLFVDLANGHVAIIDFDSGAVIDNPGDQPATWGKPGDWLAPEVTAQLAGNTKQVRVDRYSDAWAVGVGIHYLLFLHHPLVYLKDFGQTTLRDYFANDLWPQIAPGDPLFHAANDAVYAHYRQTLPLLPTPLQNAFDVLLNRGTLAPDERPDGTAWCRALGATQQPPVIVFFDPDTLFVPVGGQVRLSFQVDHAHRLYLDGVGEVTGQTSVLVAPTRDTVYTLHAHGAFGQAKASTPLVRLVQGPSPSPLPHFAAPASLFGATRSVKSPATPAFSTLRKNRWARMSQSGGVPGIRGIGGPSMPRLSVLKLPRLPRLFLSALPRLHRP